MSKNIKLVLLLAVSLVVILCLSPPSVFADDWDKATKITINHPFEIPGMVLPAGTYIFKILDIQGDRHVVRIFDEDQTVIYATILAFADWRLDTSDDTVVTFYEAPTGRVPAFHEWFYPGHRGGVEFPYPEKPEFTEAPPTAAVAEAPVIAKVEAPPVFREKPRPEPAPVIEEAYVPPTPEELEGTTGVETGPAAEPEAVPELPKTATPFPLIGLIGLLAAGAASGLGLFRK
jgi:hypothetical protein